eukprot:Skav215907  [mRNA]  locus=scaffold1542:171426:184047:- [translate_table: standard]
MVRVDPNDLDLQGTFVDLKEAFREPSLQSLIQVCNNLIHDLRGSDGIDPPTRSSAINQIYLKTGRDRVLAEFQRIHRACQLLVEVSQGRGVEVFGKPVAAAWDAERTVRAEFEGQAPGILYVADYVADSVHEETPYTSDNIERLKRLGTFPSEVPYHSHEFYQELEVQYSSLPLAAEAALLSTPSEGDHRLPSPAGSTADPTPNRRIRCGWAIDHFNSAEGASAQEQQVGRTRNSSRICGTTGYMDPELVRGQGRHRAS